jgi:hypothetical protein
MLPNEARMCGGQTYRSFHGQLFCLYNNNLIMMNDDDSSSDRWLLSAPCWGWWWRRQQRWYSFIFASWRYLFWKANKGKVGTPPATCIILCPRTTGMGCSLCGTRQRGATGFLATLSSSATDLRNIVQSPFIHSYKKTASRRLIVQVVPPKLQ